jgi:tellurite resistance protein
MAGILAPGPLEWGAWGIAVLGFVMFAGGVYKTLGPGSAGIDAEEAIRHSATVRLLMQSMLATALADGHLDDEEVAAIAAACEEVVHDHLDPASIRHMGEVIEKKGDAIYGEIGYEAKLLNVEARKAIIDACVLVLTVDGDIDARETAAVNAIAQQLGFSEIESQSMIARAIKANTA